MIWANGFSRWPAFTGSFDDWKILWNGAAGWANARDALVKLERSMFPAMRDTRSSFFLMPMVLVWVSSALMDQRTLRMWWF